MGDIMMTSTLKLIYIIKHKIIIIIIINLDNFDG